MTATTHLLTTPRSQVQFIGVRGQWVTSAYQQIARFLGARLSQSHALLFAEPVIGANAIDWFTAVEGVMQPLARLDAAERETLLRQTQTLLADVRALGQELSASARSDQQLIGQMLLNMLTFPDQGLFLAGRQAVIAGWGLNFTDADLSWRAVEIIHSKGSRRPDWAAPAAVSATPQGQPRPDLSASPIARQRPAPSAFAEGADSAAPIVVHAESRSSATAGATRTRWRQRGWIGLFAVLVFALLLAGIRGCEVAAIQWGEGGRLSPSAGSSPLVASEPADRFTATLQREQQLRQELTRLQAQLLEKRRACAAR
jgi:hypothetical protein